jgi:hypothetical protein
MAYGWAWESTTPEVDLEQLRQESLPIVREVKDKLGTMQHSQHHEALWAQLCSMCDHLEMELTDPTLPLLERRGTLTGYDDVGPVTPVGVQVQ